MCVQHVHLCAYVRAFIFMHALVYNYARLCVCFCARFYAFEGAFVCIHAHTFVCIHAHVCLRACVCLRARAFASERLRVCVLVFACLRAFACVCVRLRG